MAKLVLEVQSDQAEKALKLLKRHMKEVGIEGTVVQKRFNGMERSSMNLGRAFAFVGTAVAAIGFGRVIRDSVEAQIQFERFAGALRVATGSAAGAAEEMDFVVDTAQRLGVPLLEAADSYSKLAAAARGTSLAGETSRDIFTAVAEAATVLNLSADQTQGALTALEQIISKGKVSAEELRGQLGERLPGAFQIAARSIGVTTAELDKMLSTGKLTAEQLLPAFAAELRNTFGPEVQNAASNTLSQFNRLKNSILLLEQALGSALAPALGQVADQLSAIAANPAALEFFRDLGEFLANTVGWLTQAIKSWGLFVAAFNNSIAGLLSGLAAAAEGYSKFLAFFRFLPGVTKEHAESLEALAGTLDDMADVYRNKADKAIDLYAGGMREATRDTVSALPPLAAATNAMTELGVSANNAAKEAREMIEALKASSLKQTVDTIEEIAEGLNRLGTEMLEVGSLTANLSPSPFLPEEFDDIMPSKTKTKEMGDAFGDIWADAVANALGDALTALFSGEEIDWSQIGSSIGAAIGTAVGSAYGPIAAAAGGALGGALGGAVGGLFNDDEAEKLKEAAEAFQTLVDFVQGSLSSIEQSVINTLESILEMLAAMRGTTEQTGDEMLAVGREVQSAINEIFGIVPDDFGERIQAAIHLMERLGDLFSEELLEQFGTIDLSALTDSILAEFEGVTAHLEQASLEQTFDNLVDALRGAGLTADETAAAIRRATASYKDQQQALVNDALSPLLQMMMQFNVFENESRAKQAELMRFQAQLDLRVIEATLTALGVMDATIRRWIDALGEAISSFNFAATIPGLPGGYTAPRLPRGGGGGGRAERRRRKREDRDDVRDFLAGFELSDYENELRNINKQFDEMLEKAHGNVELEERLADARAEALQEALDTLYQPLTDLRESLQGIGDSPAQAFGGIQDEFFDLFARVQAGDTDAIRELAEAGGDYRDAILDMFGGSRRGQNLIEQMDRLLGDLLGEAGIKADDDPILNENKKHSDLLTEIRDLLASENTLHVVDKGGNIRLLRLTTEDANRFAQAQRDRLIETLERDNKTTHAHLIELIDRTRQQTDMVAQTQVRESANSDGNFKDPEVGDLT